MTLLNVRKCCLKYMLVHNMNIDAWTSAHSDAIWSSQWTTKDTVVSISADGAIIQWDSNSGQQLHALPPHTLGLISLSVSEAGDRAVYNTIEGLTQLWDLTDGSVLGSHESFARDPGATQQTEPGACIHQLIGFITIHHMPHCASCSVKYGLYLYIPKARHMRQQAVMATSPFAPQQLQILEHQHNNFCQEKVNSACL